MGTMHACNSSCQPCQYSRPFTCSVTIDPKNTQIRNLVWHRYIFYSGLVRTCRIRKKGQSLVKWRNILCVLTTPAFYSSVFSNNDLALNGFHVYYSFRFFINKKVSRLWIIEPEAYCFWHKEICVGFAKKKKMLNKEYDIASFFSVI